MNIEQPAFNQFLSDVMTAAGLIAHGKQSKALAKRLSAGVMQIRSGANDDADGWALGDYAAEACPNCGRERLCLCPNGKRRCEKCNWCPEDRAYAPVNI